MSILFDKTLGLLQAGMTVRRTHQSVTAGNIANADTPGYRAHRADFGDVLARARHRVDGPQMDRTHPAHMDTSGKTGEVTLDPETKLDDRPTRTDGNNVDLETEMAFLAANAAEFQALATVTRKKFAMMKYALDRN